MDVPGERGNDGGVCLEDSSVGRSSFGVGPEVLSRLLCLISDDVM